MWLKEETFRFKEMKVQWGGILPGSQRRGKAGEGGGCVSGAEQVMGRGEGGVTRMCSLGPDKVCVQW